MACKQSSKIDLCIDLKKYTRVTLVIICTLSFPFEAEFVLVRKWHRNLSLNHDAIKSVFRILHYMNTMSTVEWTVDRRMQHKSIHGP